MLATFGVLHCLVVLLLLRTHNSNATAPSVAVLTCRQGQQMRGYIQMNISCLSVCVCGLSVCLSDRRLPVCVCVSVCFQPSCICNIPMARCILKSATISSDIERN